MPNSIFLILALTMSAAQNASAGRAIRGMDDESNPQAYWGRGFGCSSAAENFQISLEVGDLDAAAAKAESAAAAGGAPPRMSMHDGNTQDGYGALRRYRQINYLMPLKTADKVAKKLMEIGELSNYQLNRQGADLKPLSERIAILAKELSENAAALERMPAAKYFLTSRLNEFKQSLSCSEQGASKAAINLTLMGKPGDQRP